MAQSRAFQCPTVSNNNLADEPTFRLSQGVGTWLYSFENMQVCYNNIFVAYKILTC